MPNPTEPQDDTYGFNSEISQRGVHYHVQTENMGAPPEPTSIHTLVFHSGQLVEKVIGHPESASPPLEEQVKRQHLEVLARIQRGELALKTSVR